MKRIAASTLALACMLALLGRTGRAEQFPGHLVAHFARGSRPSQLGVAERRGDEPYDRGPQGLAVTAWADVLIGDPVNGKIKRFSATGALCAATEGKLDGYFSYCVDDKGSIVVRDNSPSGTLRKFDAQGKLLWERTYADILPDDALSKAEAAFSAEFLPLLGLVACGPPDTALVSLRGWRKADRKPTSIGLLLDGKGAVIRMIPGFGAWSGGYWWAFESSMVDDQPPPTVTVKLFAPDGSLAKEIRLNTTADDGRHYKGVDTGVATVLPDGAGGCYVIAYADRAQAVQLSPKLSVTNDYVVNQYDSTGAFVREIRVPASPFGGSVSSLAVGPDGAVYYLRFTASGFDLMVIDRAK